MLDPLTLPAAYMLAALTTAQCPQQGPVDVDVQFAEENAPTNTSLSSAQLTQMFGHNMNTSLASDGKWMVGGVTVFSDPSTIQTSMQMGYMQRTDPANSDTCFTVNKVIYKITYKAPVYVASDFLNMGCRYSATLMHEKRHVDTAMRLITDEIPEMRKQLETFAESLGPRGPVGASDLAAEKQKTMQILADQLKPEWERFIAQNRVQQAQIDTLPNYMRDTALCPGQFPKFDGSK